MARSLPTNISSEIAKKAITPYELYIIVLDGTTLYFTTHDQALTFYDLAGNSQQYLPLAIKRTDIHYNADTLINHVTLTLDNVNRALGAYIAQYEFRGRRVAIRKVFEGYLSNSADYVTVFDGLMDKPKISETSLEVEAISRGGTLARKAPNRMYSVMCNWKFGSSECGFDITSTETTGTADATTSATRLVDAARTEATDYWKYGELEATSGLSNGQKRKISASSGANITADYAFASGLQSGDTYKISQGCSKTFTRCSGLSNQANYGGFPTIPEEMVLR